MQQRTGFIRIDSAVLAVKHIMASSPTPNDPTLIFLHEGLGSIDQWRSFPEKLVEATGLSAYIYDRQGYGKSVPFDRKRKLNYLHKEAFEVLPELIAKLKIANPILVGHSDGATIALLYASKFNPVCIISEAGHVHLEPFCIEGIKTAAANRKTIVQKLEKYHHEKSESVFSAWADIWLNVEFKDWNIEDRLLQISCPTLILQGEADEYATLNHPNLIKNTIGQNAELAIIEAAGHSPHLSHSAETLSLMTKFIQTSIAE
ncbi:MAG: alpha/beta hydrolase [Bacteroidota bacterium]